MGNSFYLYVSSFLYKPNNVSNEVPWHQDFMNRPDKSEKITTWISLDNSHIKNGCLKLIPGSHKHGFREWFNAKGETHHNRLKQDFFNIEDAIYVEMNACDILVFSNYLIHSSEQNQSPVNRKELRFVYKSLDNTAIPRGSPIMMRGGMPEHLK